MCSNGVDFYLACNNFSALSSLVLSRFILFVVEVQSLIFSRVLYTAQCSLKHYIYDLYRGNHGGLLTYCHHKHWLHFQITNSALASLEDYIQSRNFPLMRFILHCIAAWYDHLWNLSKNLWKMQGLPWWFKSETFCTKGAPLVSGVNKKAKEDKSKMAPNMAGGAPFWPVTVPM